MTRIHSFIITRLYSFIQVVCLTTSPKPLPKRALHIVRYRASSFKWQYPLLSLRSSSSFLRLLPCLPVTSIPPCIFPSVTHCRRQFLRKMWPIQFGFRLQQTHQHPQYRDIILHLNPGINKTFLKLLRFSPKYIFASSIILAINSCFFLYNIDLTVFSIRTIYMSKWRQELKFYIRFNLH